MAADRSAAELERFLAERAGHLLCTAVVLAGSREAGEDLLQAAVERLWRRWHRFDGDPEGYLELTSRSDSMISESIWVSPVTYLPVAS